MSIRVIGKRIDLPSNHTPIYLTYTNSIPVLLGVVPYFYYEEKEVVQEVVHSAGSRTITLHQETIVELDKEVLVAIVNADEILDNIILFAGSMSEYLKSLGELLSGIDDVK